MIEPETQAKNCAISPAERVFIMSTLSVMRLRCSVLALEPAAQAIILAILAFLMFCTARSKAAVSVGEPSVRMKTRGRQSPFWVSVDLRPER